MVYQGIDSLKKITGLKKKGASNELDVTETMKTIYPHNRNLYYNDRILHDEMVDDFAKYFQRQNNPDPRVFCDVLIFAFENGMLLGCN